MADLPRMLKALADPTRLRIVSLLHEWGELCVCELVDALQVPQYSVSRHLSVLRAAGVVSDWRQGKWMHYALHPGLSEEEQAIISAVCAGAQSGPAARQDQRRLACCLRPRTKVGAITCS